MAANSSSQDCAARAGLRPWVQTVSTYTHTIENCADIASVLMSFRLYLYMGPDAASQSWNGPRSAQWPLARPQCAKCPHGV